MSTYSTPRGQLDRPKTVDCQRPRVVDRLWRVDRPQKDTRMDHVRTVDPNHHHIDLNLLTAIQACIEGSSGGPVKPKSLLASPRGHAVALTALLCIAAPNLAMPQVTASQPPCHEVTATSHSPEIAHPGKLKKNPYRSKLVRYRIWDQIPLDGR
ncbi:hypothetical protein CROQUDRAFT_101037 [Cronartium quercuum f. sp. fusiforme G11]|uniref:Uncharacterized protein n=1 Tax=Cronartium quercuum f. sp. fusiforme G11 TaxID=708437 RepID=A0A9P6N9P3_9BASI|nr:hypothetical protein CROQUDRAFT_101037 [Cronartium quercuum f. sp. fusiforme G11]